MSVNGITNPYAAGAATTASQASASQPPKAASSASQTSSQASVPTTPANDPASSTTNATKSSTVSDGVVYEKSSTSSNKTYAPNTGLINQLKQDAENRAASMRSLVEKMLFKQGKTYNSAFDLANAIAAGSVKVDPATSKQAQEDISEDGYWGVKQTSERILSFAKALTGGDPSQIEKMRSAVKKGFGAAEKTWGGKMPSITSQTYDAIMKGFDDWANETEGENSLGGETQD